MRTPYFICHKHYPLTLDAKKSIYLVNTYSGVLSGCVIIPAPGSWIAYLLLFVFETVVLLLALGKTIQLNSQFGSTPLVERLMKDGSFFYAAMLVVVLFTCIGLGMVPDLQMAVVFSGIYTAFSSVLCSHLIFSLHTFPRSNLSMTCSSTVPPGVFRIGDSTRMRTFGIQSHVVGESRGNMDLEVQNEGLHRNDPLFSFPGLPQ
ncbi:hypothetical protein FS749_003083 [Ceratobasidium sp. UAMH 11750]|nr:hypothetical protein FS749_003083 [Ceratobasidium sp. UAMH 11750]